MLATDKLYLEGKKLLEARRFEDALSYFEQALVKSPRDPDMLNGKGATLRSLGRYDEALECFNLSLQIDPRDANAS